MKLKVLAHMTYKPFKFDPTHVYVTPDTVDYKPVGFWLSDESDHGWSQWCKGENWNTEGLRHETIFDCDVTNWKVIKSVAALEKFDKEYRAPKFPGLLTSGMDLIDWAKAKKDYAGILISPYHWEARHHRDIRWYYSWDCASACVWDLSTINPIFRSPAIKVPRQITRY